jgi:hypothetical protein
VRVIRGSGKASFAFVGMGPGDLLLESITKAARQAGIRNGAVIAGAGTLKRLRMHHVTHSRFPPTDRFVTIRKPLEVTSISGLIADGEPHLHITVSWKDRKVWAGHLEPGSEVLYLAEAALVGLGGTRMTRRADLRRKIRLLDRS